MRNRLLFGLTLLWVVAFATSITVLLSIPLFRLDIGWENLTQIANFPRSVLIHNYHVLMQYELNPFIAHLKMPNFPDSTNALKHFAEVRNLFTLVNILSIVLIPAIIIFLKEHLPILYRRGIFYAMVVPILLAVVAALIGFDNFFIIFHKILFRDNTWLFDPTTDPIINVLTDNFFMFCFIIFVILYEGILTFLLVKGRLKQHRKTF